MVKEGARFQAKWLLALMLIGFLGWVLFAALRARPAVPPINIPPPAVGVAVAEYKDVRVLLNAIGTMTAPNAVNVHSRIEGVLQAIHFKEGQQVKAGDLLAEIEAKTYQAQLMQAEGQLQKDQALLSNARLDLVRYQQLWEHNAIAKQMLDTQQALVRQYEGTVKVDEGNVAYAKAQLSYAKIYAPVAGRMGLRNVNVGNVVRPSDSTPIVSITQNQPIDAVFAVPEPDLMRVLQPWRAGKKLRVEAWDRDGRTLLDEGVLQTVDNQINTETGTVSLKARFSNAKQWLFPNQFVNVKLVLDTLKNQVVVPTAAIQQGNAGAYVYLLEDENKVAVHSVQTGPSEGVFTVIEKGVRVGQQVVVDGVDKLRDGSTIRPVMRANQANQANRDKPSPP